MCEKKSKLRKLYEDHNPNLKEIDEKILKNINYSRKQMELDLVELKNWLKCQHHLPECRLTECDNFLTNYLTGCKGSLETVKQKLDTYYSLRGKSEVYDNRDPLDEEYRKTCERNHICVLPKFSENGECILISKLANPEILPSLMINSVKRAIRTSEIGIREIGGIVKNSIIMIDYENYSRAHAMLYTPEIFRDSLHLFQNVFPIRITKIILYNTPPFTEILINTVVKPFLEKKLIKKFIVITGGPEELHKYCDKTLLPKDWQGDLPLTIKEINDIWNEYEINHREWFLNELSQLTNESKRIVFKKNVKNSYFNLQGTVKKLAIE